MKEMQIMCHLLGTYGMHQLLSALLVSIHSSWMNVGAKLPKSQMFMHDLFCGGQSEEPMQNLHKHANFTLLQ
jgi:hypothetical protein